VKTLVIAMSLAALATTSAMAQAPEVKAIRRDAAHIYQSSAQGDQESCSQDIDRAWAQVNAKIHARSAFGRSVPQSTTALLHRQPTQSSVAAAEIALVDVWLPMETAVAALSHAREADRANDRIACQDALAEAQREIGL
jgi:Skp family chaperone for outer membrane proteins